MFCPYSLFPANFGTATPESSYCWNPNPGYTPPYYPPLPQINGYSFTSTTMNLSLIPTTPTVSNSPPPGFQTPESLPTTPGSSSSTPPGPTFSDSPPTRKPQRICSHCHVSESCRWMNVKSRDGILCNACFTYRRKYKVNRPIDVAYPHSSAGRLVTIAYSLLMIPIYIAFKFEFGTFLAHALVVTSSKTREYLRSVYHKVRNRIFVARIPLNPEDQKSLHRDHLIFISSVLLCTICLLFCSTIFSISEDISFSSSVYFGIITMTLIGLGDIVPTNLVWFSAYCLFFLISDVLSNQIFYFCQARIRVLLHYAARRLLLLEDEDNDLRSESTVSLQNVPVINSQCMPSLVMECERHELDKDEKLISSLGSS